MYFSKNIKYLRESRNLSQQKLGDEMGNSSRSAISSYEDGRAQPKLEVVSQIADYFDITIDELLNVDLEEAQKDGSLRKAMRNKYTSGENMRLLTVTVDSEGKDSIVLVPEKAAAGYTTGYADEKYISKLQRYELPFLPRGRTYRAFEIAGDSMLPLKPQSIVIGEYAEDWNVIKNGMICIVVTKDGIVLKKVYNQIKNNGTLLLKSNNILYESYEIEASDILEVWKFAACITREFPEENQLNLQDIKNAVWRLEDEIRSVKQDMKKR